VPHARPAHANDLQEITTRNLIARHVIDRFSLAFPTLAAFWRQIDDALADILALADEIASLLADTAEFRLDRANLAAAGRATIAAYLSGESDPLSYLRDELQVQGFYSQQGGA
jgi:hypothetical protein